MIHITGVVRSWTIFVGVFFVCVDPAFAESRRYIISGSSIDTAGRAVRGAGGSVDHSMRYHSGLVAILPEAAIGALRRKLGSSVKIEEDHVVEAKGKPVGGNAVQPVQSKPWGIDAVRAPEAWVVNRGTGVKVCVIDTGVQKDHPDLAANVVGGENFVVIKGSINPGLFGDDNGHGTHVSGTIAALDNAIGVIGVAPESKIFAVKALDRRGSGYLSDIADGIRSCIANGAAVISMSLGASQGADLLAKAVSEAIAAGIVVVAAAGNESGPVSYPAKYPGVLAVSAVDSELKFASYSNFGPEIAFAAPGSGVLSSVKGSAYATYSGTSMATPHVAGVAALMIGARGVRLTGTDIGLAANQQGEGLIDASKTVQSK